MSHALLFFLSMLGKSDGLALSTTGEVGKLSGVSMKYIVEPYIPRKRMLGMLISLLFIGKLKT